MLTDNKFRAQSLQSLYYFLANMDSIELLQILIGSYYEVFCHRQSIYKPH